MCKTSLLNGIVDSQLSEEIETRTTSDMVKPWITWRLGAIEIELWK